MMEQVKPRQTLIIRFYDDRATIANLIDGPGWVESDERALGDGEIEKLRSLPEVVNGLG